MPPFAEPCPDKVTDPCKFEYFTTLQLRGGREECRVPALDNQIVFRHTTDRGKTNRLNTTRHARVVVRKPSNTAHGH